MLFLLLVSLVFLFLGILSFFTQRIFFRIPPVIFETIGITSLSFYHGFYNNIFVLYILLVGFILAAIFDPYVWNKVTGENVNNSKKISFVLNGTMGVITVIFFFIGKLVVLI